MQSSGSDLRASSNSLGEDGHEGREGERREAEKEHEEGNKLGGDTVEEVDDRNKEGLSRCLDDRKNGSEGGI